MTKEQAFEDMYEQLYYNEGPIVIYKLTNSRDGRTPIDMAYIAIVNGRCGKILTWGGGPYEQCGKRSSNCSCSMLIFRKCQIITK